MTITLRPSDGEDVAFKVKGGTSLAKIFAAFAERKKVGLESLRFMLDGARVSASGSDTVRSLDMQDGDMIDVFVEQTGGFVGFVKP